jgi:hypothetical protein
VVDGRSTRSLDLTEMPWHIQDVLNIMQRRIKPVKMGHWEYFHVTEWKRMPYPHLAVAIRKIATEEYLATGPTRARYRAKRLRAVEVFRSRFGEKSAIEGYSERRLPWERR